jgi:predicted DNA-binding protein
MKKERQVSAFVSDATHQRLDMFVRETGITKSRTIEDAIMRHLDALDSLPASAIIPTRIVLDKDSGQRFFERLQSKPEPTEALIRLMRTGRT